VAGAGGAGSNRPAPKNADEAMKAAQERWEDQIREGRVKNVSASSAGQLMKDGWKLLDVRPEHEVKKAAVDGAVTVPIFVPENDLSPGSLIKNATAFGMGGWWLGGSHMKPNGSFLADVQSQIPKDAKVIVACQKGLRSLAACEQLSRAGYDELAWINGGFDTARKEDLPVTGAPDMRFGGIGGLSEFLGWTDVQRENTGKDGFVGGFQNIIKLAAVILALDTLWFGYDLAKYFVNKQ